MPLTRLKAEENIKAHRRGIEISSFPCDKKHMLVVGELTDDRLHDYFLISGEKKDAGRLHHMVIRLLVEMSSMTIVDHEVEMLTVPRDVCMEMQESLSVITGLQIKPGYSGKIRTLLGGVRGCSHLVTLLIDMGPAAMQGLGAIMAQNPVEGDKAKKLRRARGISRFLANTCYVWREDGPTYKKLLEKINKDQDK